MGVAPDTSFTMPDASFWQEPPALEAEGDAFTRRLVISAVEPDSGPLAGLQKVRIDGSGFIEGTRVIFGQTPATEVFVQGDDRITVHTPPHARGTVDVHRAR